MYNSSFRTSPSTTRPPDHHHPSQSYPHVSDRPRDPRDPVSPASSRFPPSANGVTTSPRSRSGSNTVKTYYDPTRPQPQQQTFWEPSHLQSNRPPGISTQSSSGYPPYRDATRTYESNPTSPISMHRVPHSPTSAGHHYHGFNTLERRPPSPARHSAFHRAEMTQPPPLSSVSDNRPQTQNNSPQSPRRPADPMSLSSIISKPNNEADTTRSPESAKTSSRPPVFQTPRAFDVTPKPAATQVMDSQSLKDSRSVPPPASQPTFLNGLVHPGPAPVVHQARTQTPSSQQSKKAVKAPSSSDKMEVNGNHVKPPAPSPSTVKQPKTLPVVTEKELEAALAKIDDAELSDIEAPGYEQQKLDYKRRCGKRQRTVDEHEAGRRKRRRIAELRRLALLFDQRAERAQLQFFRNNEAAAHKEIQDRTSAEDKEKKKVQQRNRRRELQKQKHEREMAELQQRADQANDAAEREKLLKEAQKAEKKVTNTTRLLNGEIPNRDLREATPLAPNMEGGQMGSFPMSDEVEPAKKKSRSGGRLKKSREQKQAEKDAAAAAHAAIERGDDLAPLAPKGEPTKTSSSKKETAAAAAAAAAESSAADKGPYHSKAYTTIYDAIWKDISRKDIPKLIRIKDQSLNTKQSNLRKTAQLSAKEARRWQLKTNKSQKDTQARAKRVMREMLSFWKRNEREERDQRKMAERQELESARKAEADREANRQKRKLNFLISQTELYSHFIGKKVKTDEVERSTDDVTASTEKIQPGNPNAHTIDLPNNVKPGPRVTNFEDLDFDAEDETELHNAAMANAQNAVEEAQARARAFNQEDLDEEGEMNFQNPTSLQNIDIPQPKMLTCALKEYQLKGLNWLVNLYEQGINGILADEMGLGKTVQSISVMAHLAEAHNIWGPFLVIAPASTLHNWQQEIVRFVPGLKVLPYWGNAKDRKILRKFWDRKHITYSRDSQFHVLVTSYQLVVQDTQYFQRVKWQYMILDEAQAIKSSQSSRWKSLLGFQCRNRLLLTGTPIQNNMQELWALLHFIMPSLFDSHDEFSDWFSKDIESHAQSNTKLNEDQLKRLHMILKPFMLRRIKKHVQKELGDKIEEDVYCDLTYRQRAYYTNLRNKISLMDLIEKAAVGDDQDTATLMNLVMQFRKVCNHPDLFERAETSSPVSFSYFAETASFLREGHSFDFGYSVRNLIEFKIPRLVGYGNGRLDLAGPDNPKAGWRAKALRNTFNIWTPENLAHQSNGAGVFTWLPLSGLSAGEVASTAHKDYFQRAVDLRSPKINPTSHFAFSDDKENAHTPAAYKMLRIVDNNKSTDLASKFPDGYMNNLLNVSRNRFEETGLGNVEAASRPAASAPPVELYASSQGVIKERQSTIFNVPMRRALFGTTEKIEEYLVDKDVPTPFYPVTHMLPAPNKTKARYTSIHCPSMRRFVTDSGKLAKLDQVLRQLKEGGHRVLLYFQMTRMIDLMEEYLTYRNYKYCRLDGSTKLEDRRDTVADFQTRNDIFIFLLSTRAGGLGINLTAADTVIFYDSDWNPTIDSQAMDRAHRLGQTRQVTVYRMITRGTIEERIRRRALQKEEVQRVVISGGAGAQVDFNTRSRENRTKDIAMWLADDEQAEQIEKKEKELREKEEREGPTKRGRKAGSTNKRGKEVSLDDMYHEGEGHFDDSTKPSGAATPIEAPAAVPAKRKGISKKAKSVREKLAIIDGGA